MPHIEFAKLTDAQRAEAIALRPTWKPEEFPNFAFWVKPDGHLSRHKGGHILTEAAYQAVLARVSAPVRSKGDLHDWKPGVVFGFSNK